jgi:hypothetical protein
MAARGTGLRTIWITLRAANYTSTVFSGVIRQIDFLNAKEQQLAAQSIFMARAAMSAGLMFSVLGKELGGTAGQYLKLTSYMMYLVSAISMVKTAYTILTGVNWAHQVSVMGLTLSYKQLAIAMGAATAGLLIAFSILSAIKNPILDVIVLIGALIVALWALFVAESAASLGIALVAGGVAAGAAAALASYYGAFQMGTRMVGATGPAIVHKGEIIYNPSTGRPTQIGKDLESGRQETNYYEMPVTIETVNTKADIDDLDEKLSEVWRRRMRQRR